MLVCFVTLMYYFINSGGNSDIYSVLLFLILLQNTKDVKINNLYHQNVIF